MFKTNQYSVNITLDLTRDIHLINPEIAKRVMKSAKIVNTMIMSIFFGTIALMVFTAGAIAFKARERSPNKERKLCMMLIGAAIFIGARSLIYYHQYYQPFYVTYLPQLQEIASQANS